jgi:hypothetical protein
MRKISHPLALALALAAAPLGCGAPAETATPDGLDPASADAITTGAARARGFKDPSLSESETDAVVARYAAVDPEHLVAPSLLRDALVYYDVNRTRLGNKAHLGVIDFSRNDATKRFYLIDMATGAVTPHAVAHGEGSDDGKGNSVRFSNVDGSHQSSLGFVVTGEVYTGTFGRSLRLDGLSTTNSNMRSRAVVMHGYEPVLESPAANVEQGKSYGCFALDLTVKDATITALAGGALIYAGLGTPATP